MSIPIASVLFAVVDAGVGSFAIPKFNVSFVFIRFWDGVSLWDWQGVVLSGEGAASVGHVSGPCPGANLVRSLGLVPVGLDAPGLRLVQVGFPVGEVGL